MHQLMLPCRYKETPDKWFLNLLDFLATICVCENVMTFVFESF